MKTLIPFIAVALALLTGACTTPPPVTGTFTTKAGTVIVHPSGRFEIIVEPRSGK